MNLSSSAAMGTDKGHDSFIIIKKQIIRDEKRFNNRGN
jgi:hypothetical protein